MLAERLVHIQNIPVEATGGLVHCCDHAKSPVWGRALGWLRSVSKVPEQPGASHSGSKHNPAAARAQAGAAAHPHAVLLTHRTGIPTQCL